MTRRGPAQRTGLARSAKIGSVSTRTPAHWRRNVQWFTNVTATDSPATSTGGGATAGSGTVAGHGSARSSNVQRSRSRTVLSPRACGLKKRVPSQWSEIGKGIEKGLQATGCRLPECAPGPLALRSAHVQRARGASRGGSVHLRVAARAAADADLVAAAAGRGGWRGRADQRLGRPSSCRRRCAAPTCSCGRRRRARSSPCRSVPIAKRGRWCRPSRPTQAVRYRIEPSLRETLPARAVRRARRVSASASSSTARRRSPTSASRCACRRGSRTCTSAAATSIRC